MGGGIKTNPDDPVRQAASPPPFAKLSWERSPALTRACSALPGLEELPQGLPHRLHRGGVLLPDRVHQDAAAAAVQEQPGVQGNGGLRHADHQEERPARALQGRAPAVRRASPASPARARATSGPLLNRSALCVTQDPGHFGEAIDPLGGILLRVRPPQGRGGSEAKHVVADHAEVER